MGDIVIAVCLGLVTLITAYLGVHVTLHPAQSAREKWAYKIGFTVCGLVACTLIGFQTYRSNKAQRELRSEVSAIKRNTERPPKVEVTNNVPVPSVILQNPGSVLVDRKSPVLTKRENRLQSLTNKEVKKEALAIAAKMRNFENVMHNQIATVAPAGLFSAVTEDEQEVYTHNRLVYNQTILGDAIAVRDELLKRLNRLPSADLMPDTHFRMTSSAFIPQGPEWHRDDMGKEPISDGAAYLEKLATELPNR